MRKLSMSELDRLTVSEFIHSEKIPIAVVLDNVRSALNIGSIFRTADAFRVQEIILVGISAQPPHRDILKSALGATETVVWRYFETQSKAIQYIQSQNYVIVPVEQTDCSIKLSSFNCSDKNSMALIFGNEVNGVSDDFLNVAEHSLEVEQMGMKHSLNVSVCAGIVLHHIRLQLNSSYLEG